MRGGQRVASANMNVSSNVKTFIVFLWSLLLLYREVVSKVAQQMSTKGELRNSQNSLHK